MIKQFSFEYVSKTQKAAVGLVVYFIHVVSCFLGVIRFRAELVIIFFIRFIIFSELVWFESNLKTNSRKVIVKNCQKKCRSHVSFILDKNIKNLMI